jgi:hypothetical protein
MGGAVAAFLSILLENETNYKGAVFLAPALSAKLPSWLVVKLLEFTVGTCTPESEMPTWLSKVSDNTKTWKVRIK